LPLCDLFFKRAQVKRGKSVRDMREGKGVYKDIKAGLDGRDRTKHVGSKVCFVIS
jgi:hypothetical protein